MSAIDQSRGFYNEHGQIADQNTGHEIASLEQPARDRELELRRQQETGLTEEEKNNIAIMEGIKEKYPLAIRYSIVDPRGRQYLIIEPYQEWQSMADSKLVLTPQAGILYITYQPTNQKEYLSLTEGNMWKKWSDHIDLAGVADRISTAQREGSAWSHYFEFDMPEQGDFFQSKAKITQVDPQKPDLLALLKKRLAYAQAAGEERATTLKSKLSPEDILAQL